MAEAVKTLGKGYISRPLVEGQSKASKTRYSFYLPDELWCTILQFAFECPAEIQLTITKRSRHGYPVSRCKNTSLPVHLLRINKLFLTEGLREIYGNDRAFAFHVPQYLSYTFTRKVSAEALAHITRLKFAIKVSEIYPILELHQGFTSLKVLELYIGAFKDSMDLWREASKMDYVLRTLPARPLEKLIIDCFVMDLSGSNHRMAVNIGKIIQSGLREGLRETMPNCEVAVQMRHE